MAATVEELQFLHAWVHFAKESCNLSAGLVYIGDNMEIYCGMLFSPDNTLSMQVLTSEANDLSRLLHVPAKARYIADYVRYGRAER